PSTSPLRYISRPRPPAVRRAVRCHPHRRSTTLGPSLPEGRSPGAPNPCKFQRRSSAGGSRRPGSESPRTLGDSSSACSTHGHVRKRLQEKLISAISCQLHMTKTGRRLAHLKRCNTGKLLTG